MNTATTTTFDVSDVKRANEPLPEVPHKDAVEAQITPGKSRNFRMIIDPKGSQKRQDVSSERHASRPIEGCTRPKPSVIHRVPGRKGREISKTS